MLPLTLLIFGALFAYTYNAATTKLGEKPSGDLPGSMWTRKLIVQESWHKARDAGPFGYGLRADLQDTEASDDDRFDLKSVDNTYMNFTLTHGWIYTALWISIGIFFSFRMTRGFNAVTHPGQIFPPGGVDRDRAGVDGFDVHRMGGRALHRHLGDHAGARQHAHRWRAGSPPEHRPAAARLRSGPPGRRFVSIPPATDDADHAAMKENRKEK